MRKITLGLANSLDNYIARKDGGSDWLHWSKEVAEISSKFLKTVDTILIGRKTYEVMLAFGQTSYPGKELRFLTIKAEKLRAKKESGNKEEARQERRDRHERRR